MMQTVAVNFKNEIIAEQVLWMLKRFEDDGVEIVPLDDPDDEILESFTSGLQEIKQIKRGTLSSRSAQEFLNEL